MYRFTKKDGCKRGSENPFSHDQRACDTHKDKRRHRRSPANKGRGRGARSPPVSFSGCALRCVNAWSRQLFLGRRRYAQEGFTGMFRRKMSLVSSRFAVGMKRAPL